LDWEEESPTIGRETGEQSVSRWCYEQIPLEELCVYAAQIGLKAIDLLNPDE
jgi:hydroxypyruvate isomerase